MSFCPVYTISNVRDDFNSIVEAFSGTPLSMEEFSSKTLRLTRSGNDLVGMEAAYYLWDLYQGDMDSIRNSTLYKNRAVVVNVLKSSTSKKDAVDSLAKIASDLLLTTNEFKELIKFVTYITGDTNTIGVSIKNLDGIKQEELINYLVHSIIVSKSTNAGATTEQVFKDVLVKEFSLIFAAHKKLRDMLGLGKHISRESVKDALLKLTESGYLKTSNIDSVVDLIINRLSDDKFIKTTEYIYSINEELIGIGSREEFILFRALNPSTRTTAIKVDVRHLNKRYKHLIPIVLKHFNLSEDANLNEIDDLTLRKINLALTEFLKYGENTNKSTFESWLKDDYNEVEDTELEFREFKKSIESIEGVFVNTTPVEIQEDKRKEYESVYRNLDAIVNNFSTIGRLVFINLKSIEKSIDITINESKIDFDSLDNFDVYDLVEEGEEGNEILEYDKSLFEREPKISAVVKRLFFGISTGEKNFLGKDKFIDYYEALSVVRSILKNSIEDFDSMVSTLRSFEGSIPWMKNFVDKLEAEASNNEAIKKAFRNNMAMSYVNHYSLMYGTSRDGKPNMVFVRVNDVSTINNVVQSWLDGLVDSKYIKDDLSFNKEALLADYKKAVASRNIIEIRKFIDSLGIEMSDHTWNIIKAQGVRIGSGYLKDHKILTSQRLPFYHIVKAVSNNSTVGEVVDIISKDSSIKRLAEYEVLNNPYIFPISHRSGGKVVYSYSWHTYLSHMIEKIKTDKDFELLDRLLSYGYYKNNPILNGIRNGDPLYIDNVNLGVVALEAVKNFSTKGAKDNKKLAQLTEAEYELFLLGSIVSGIHNNTDSNAKIIPILTPITSDKGTYFFVSMPEFNVKLTKDGNLTSEALEELYKVVVEPEINRMMDVKGIIESDEDTIPTDYIVGSMMFYFIPELNSIKELFDEDGLIVDEITPEIKDKILSVISKAFNASKEAKLNNWKKYNVTAFVSDKVVEEFSLKYGADKSTINDVLAGYVTLQGMLGLASIYTSFFVDIAHTFKTNSFLVKPFKNVLEKKGINTSNPIAMLRALDQNQINMVHRATMYNYNKRSAMFIANGRFNGDGNSTVRYIFVEDKRIDSLMYDQLKEVLGDKAKAYSKSGALSESTNAQEFVTLSEYMRILYEEGSISSELYDKTTSYIQDRINQGDFYYYDGLLEYLQDNNLLEEFNSIVFNPIKPVYNWIEQNDYIGVSPVYIKSSAYPLLPSINNKEITEIRKLMEKHNIDRMVFPSGAKLGTPLAPLTLWDDDGNIRTDIKEEEVEAAVKPLSREGLRIQQEVPFHGDKFKINRGSQADKNLFMDILKVRGFVFEGKTLTGEELAKIYMERYDKLYTILRDKLLEEINYDYKSNTFNRKALISLIKEEAIIRDHDLLISGILDSPYALELLPYFGYDFKFESLLNSLIKTRILKIKFPGFSSVLSTEEGYQSKNLNLSKSKAKQKVSLELDKDKIVKTIYNRLGKKTASGNVVIKEVYNKEGVEYARSISGVFSLKVEGSKRHFGNPFTSNKDAAQSEGLILTNSTKESIEKYINWVLFSDKSKWTNHSGGAYGSDLQWDVIGKEYGMLNNKHYYIGERTPYNAPYGNVNLEDSKEGMKIIEEGAVQAALAAKRNYGYNYDSVKDSRLIKNWAQVKNADAIYAIGKIVKPGEALFNDDRIAQNVAVTGETGYAVSMAINNNKPVYVFNQEEGSYDVGWYMWDYATKDFVKTETPILTENFAGIGTRKINDLGREAIKDVYKKTKEYYYDRAEWIRSVLMSGQLKGKPIVYHKELGEPSHATALDYLINKYSWNKNDEAAFIEPESESNTIVIPEDEVPESGLNDIVFTDNWKGTLDPGSFTDADGKVLTGEELRLALENGTAIVKRPAQIIIPWRFKINGKDVDIKDFIDPKTGKIDLNKIDRNVLEAFGMRIPNVGLSSQSYMEVVGFLPSNYGDVVIAPRDFLAQMGSDFDVDKLYAYLSFLFIDGNGKLRSITSETVESFLNELKSISNNPHHPMAAHYNNPASIKKAISDAEYYALTGDIKEIHNAVIKNTHPIVIRKNTSPTDYWKFGDIADAISNSESIKNNNIVTDEYHKQARMDAQSGKDLIGPFAIINNILALFQYTKFNIGPLITPELKGFPLRLGEYKFYGSLSRPLTLKSEKIYLKRLMEKYGLPLKEAKKLMYTPEYYNDITKLMSFDEIEFRSDVLNGLIQSSVDNQNQQILGRIGINDLNVNAAVFLVLAGFGEEVGYLLKLPMVEEFYKNLKSSLSSLTDNYVSPSEAVAKALKITVGEQNMDMFAGMAEDFEFGKCDCSILSLDNIKNTVLNSDNISESKKLEVNLTALALLTSTAFQQKVAIISDIVKVARVDSSFIGTTYEEVNRLGNKFFLLSDRVRTGVFSDTSIQKSAFEKGVYTALGIYKLFYPKKFDGFSYFKSLVGKRDDVWPLFSTASLSLEETNPILSKYGSVSNLIEEAYNVNSKKNVARIARKLKKHPLFYTNKFIQSLVPTQYSNKYRGVSLPTHNSFTTDRDIVKDLLALYSDTNVIEEIEMSPREFVELLVGSELVSGGTYKKGSFLTQVHASIYEDIGITSRLAYYEMPREYAANTYIQYLQYNPYILPPFNGDVVNFKGDKAYIRKSDLSDVDRTDLYMTGFVVIRIANERGTSLYLFHKSMSDIELGEIEELELIKIPHFHNSELYLFNPKVLFLGDKDTVIRTRPSSVTKFNSTYKVKNPVKQEVSKPKRSAYPIKDVATRLSTVGVKTPYLKFLVEEVLFNLDQPIDLKVEFVENVPYNGYYEFDNKTQTGKILIKKDLAAEDTDKLARVIVHESLHHVYKLANLMADSNPEIRRALDGLKFTLDEYVEWIKSRYGDSYNEFLNLYSEYRKALSSNDTDKAVSIKNSISTKFTPSVSRIMYASVSVDEFMAETLTNHQFAKNVLNNIKSSKKATLLDKIANFFSRILKALNIEIHNDSLLHNALVHSLTIINSVNAGGSTTTSTTPTTPTVPTTPTTPTAPIAPTITTTSTYPGLNLDLYSDYISEMREARVGMDIPSEFAEFKKDLDDIPNLDPKIKSRIFGEPKRKEPKDDSGLNKDNTEDNDAFVGSLSPGFDENIPSHDDVRRMFNELTRDGKPKLLAVETDGSSKNYMIMLKRVQRINAGQNWYRAFISKTTGEGTSRSKVFYFIDFAPRKTNQVKTVDINSISEDEAIDRMFKCR